MNALETVAGSLGIGAAVLALVQSARYELRDDALCVMYGRFCVRRVAYENIAELRRGTALWNEHYSRLSRDPNITLRLKKGVLAPNLVINPAQTAEFESRLRAHLGR